MWQISPFTPFHFGSTNAAPRIRGTRSDSSKAKRLLDCHNGKTGHRGIVERHGSLRFLVSTTATESAHECMAVVGDLVPTQRLRAVRRPDRLAEYLLWLVDPYGQALSAVSANLAYWAVRSDLLKAGLARSSSRSDRPLRTRGDPR